MTVEQLIQILIRIAQYNPQGIVKIPSIEGGRLDSDKPLSRVDETSGTDVKLN